MAMHNSLPFRSRIPSPGFKQYDFQHYLSTLDPHSQYHIHVLKSSPLKQVVRATRINKLSAGCRWWFNTSLILEYAPPYESTNDPGGPLSALVGRRNLREVDIFVQQSLFNPNTGPLTYISNQEEEEEDTEEVVRVPELLHHCSESGVLVISDPGEFVTLWDILTPSRFENLTVPHVNTLRSIGSELGRKIGRFFAKLHSAFSRKNVERCAPAAKQKLDSTFVSILETKVLPVLERLRTYGTDIDSETAQELFRRVVKVHSTIRGSCFTHGDLHPGAILIRHWPELITISRLRRRMDDENEYVYMSVVDWKWAKLNGCGIDGDMAQLLASLHCHRIYLEALKSGSPGPNDRVEEALLVTHAIVWGICTSYSEVIQIDQDVHASRQTATLLRSALVLHGREMINGAVERDWFIPTGFRVDKTLLIKKMVGVGIKYLQQAGKHRAEMLDNWSKHPVDEDAYIKSLFGI
ncbi:hypothetical protein Hte_012330 [Hypoxylon texense]